MNNDKGLAFDGASSGNTFSQIAAVNNRTKGVDLANYSTNGKFAGLLVVGNNPENCNVTGGSNPGLTDTNLLKRRQRRIKRIWRNRHALERRSEDGPLSRFVFHRKNRFE